MNELLILAEKATVIALLIFAVWWLNKQNEKRQDALDQEREKQNALRDKRETDRDEQLTDLKRAKEECEQDRSNLHESIAVLETKLDFSTKLESFERKLDARS